MQNDYEFVRADNDWSAEQVAPYPDRLIGLCGLNPLKDYALSELARCAKNPNVAPRITWAVFRKLPLSDAEFRTIENNIAPYMR